MDVDTEFFEALPTDGMVRQFARLDMSADKVPAVGIPPTGWMATHQERTRPSRTSAATEIGTWATMAAHYARTHSHAAIRAARSPLLPPHELPCMPVP